MIAYTVHEQPDPPADRLDRAEALVLVRDGFSLGAAAMAPLYLAAKRLWLPLAVYLGTVVVIVGVVAAFGLDPRWAGLLILAVHVLVGLEADTMERMALDRRGWQMVGTVTGRSADDCERRFLDQWLPNQPVIARGGHGGGHGGGLGGASAGTLSAAADEVASGEPELGLWRRILRGRSGPRRHPARTTGA